MPPQSQAAPEQMPLNYQTPTGGEGILETPQAQRLRRFGGKSDENQRELSFRPLTIDGRGHETDRLAWIPTQVGKVYF